MARVRSAQIPAEFFEGSFLDAEETARDHDAVIQHRRSVLSDINASADLIYEVTLQIKHQLQFAAALFSQRSTGGRQSEGASPHSEDLDAAELQAAITNITQSLNTLFPIFEGRDALFENEIAGPSLLKQLDWEEIAFALPPQHAAKKTARPSLPASRLSNPHNSSPTPTPTPLRPHFLTPHQLVQTVGAFGALSAQQVFLNERHDDYANSANTPEWEELQRKAAALEELVASLCSPHDAVVSQFSLAATLDHAYQLIATVIRIARGRLTLEETAASITDGDGLDLNQLQESEYVLNRLLLDTGRASANNNGDDQDDVYLLDPLRITGQGCQFHLVMPTHLSSDLVAYLRGRDTRDVVFDKVCLDFKSVRLVRVVCVTDPESEFSAMSMVEGEQQDSPELTRGDRDVDFQAATLQKLVYSPVDNHTTNELPFDTQAAFWLSRRLFNPKDIVSSDLIAPSSLVSVVTSTGPICFNATRSYEISLLDYLHDPSCAPHLTQNHVVELALLSMLLLIDDASGSGISVSKAEAGQGGAFALHNISLFRNPIEHLKGNDVVLGWRSPLWCSEWVLDAPVTSELRQRIQRIAPACVLLKWLGDMQKARDEVDNMIAQDALPFNVDVFAQSVRPGVMIRLHRTLIKMHQIFSEHPEEITVGSLLQRLFPVCAEFYEKHRKAAKGDVKKTFTRTQQCDFISSAIADSHDIDGSSRLLHLENILEQPIPHLAKIPSAFPSSRGQPRRTQAFPLVEAVKELLHAPCLDEEGHPLARYSEECKLELVLHLSSEFPELDRSVLPSYWNDPSLLHTILSVASDRLQVTPHAVWLFRDYINVSINGTTPLHLVISSFRGSITTVQKQIDYMVGIGADVDGPDSKGLAPVDICAENHPDIFLQLIGLGAHGGRRTVLLSKLYFKLLQSSDNDAAPLLAGLRALIERNRQLNWAISLRQILPPMPGETLVNIRGETISDRCLTEPFFSQLFKNNTFNTRVPRVSGRRPVGAIECGEHWISFKLRPEFPGIESISGHLSRTLFGDWIAPYVELLRVQDNLPILAALGVSGNTLHSVMEKSPKLLSFLDFQYVSMAILNAMIISPEDGKPSDYIVEPIEDGKYRLVCVDNERSFCPTANAEPLVEPHVNLAAARSTRKVAPFMRPKCVLFCLDQMLRPVDPEVRDHVLSLDMPTLVRKWVAKSVLVNTSHRALFSQKEALELLRLQEPVVVGVPMAKELPVQILDKLLRLQRVLSSSPNATHFDILRVLEPTQAERYGKVLLPQVVNHHLGLSSSSTSAQFASLSSSGPTVAATVPLAFTTPYERFLAVDKPLLHEAFDHSVRSNISTEDFVLACGIKDIKLVPQLTLPGLDNCPENSRKHFDHAFGQLTPRDELQLTLKQLETEPELLEGLFSTVEQERWLRELDFSMLTDTAQEAVLSKLYGMTLQTLTIRNARVLRDAFVMSKLSLRHVTCLDLSGSTKLQLTGKLATHLATQCPALSQLVLQQLSMLQFIVRQRTTTFPALKVLDLTGCKYLTVLNFAAPVLHQLIVNDCTSLSDIEVNTPQLVKLSMMNCHPERAHTNSIEDHNLELSSDAPATSPSTSLSSDAFASLQRKMQWARMRLSFARGRPRTEEGAPEDSTTKEESGTDSHSGDDILQVSRVSTDFWWKNVVKATLDGPALASLSPTLYKQAVKLAKDGLPPALRGDIWLRLTGGKTLQQADASLYESALKRRFGETVPSLTELSRSFFGHFIDLRRFGLDHRQQVAAGRVLCCLAQEYNDTQYCPWLPMLIACCVTCMEEREAFVTGSALLNRDASLIRTRKETWLMLCTFDDLANRLLPEARAALLGLLDFREGDDLRLHPLRGAVLTWFADCLPRQSLLIFLDNFLVKGRKIFYRYGLAILRRWYRDYLTRKESSAENQDNDQADDSTQHTQHQHFVWPEEIARQAHDALTLAEEAFSFSFSSKDIERSEKAAHVAAWNALTVSGLVSGVDEVAINDASATTGDSWLESNVMLVLQGDALKQRPVHDSWDSMPMGVSPSKTATLRQKSMHRSPCSASMRFSTSLRRIQQQMHSMLMTVYSDYAHQTQADSVVSLDMLADYAIPRDMVALEEQLGHGAFGQVHRGVIGRTIAEDIALPSPLQRALQGKDKLQVAVKSVLASAETEEQAKFLLEASLMVSLRHRNLVAMLGICHTQLPYLLVLEYMMNGSCRSYLHACRKPDGPEKLSQNKVRSVGMQVASALAYLHEHRIVHRDLAARNVLVGHSLELVKLADFGLSRTLGDENYYRKTTQEKTPIKWQAPESTADGIYTPVSDVWSLGIFMWEVSTYGEKPYAGMSNIDAHYHVLNGYRLSMNPLCEGQLYSLMSKCWEAQPQHRPASALMASMLAEVTVSTTEQDYSSVRGLRKPGRASIVTDRTHGDDPYLQPVVTNSQPSRPASTPSKLASAAEQARVYTAYIASKPSSNAFLGGLPAVPPRHTTVAVTPRLAQRARLNSNRLSWRPVRNLGQVSKSEGPDACA
eukprot:m.236658 g.236658  ORF g.236658 m.236658 type:complete len:2502 (-) comp17102_c0_seq1:316-7821(-)